MVAPGYIRVHNVTLIIHPPGERRALKSGGYGAECTALFLCIAFVEVRCTPDQLIRQYMHGHIIFDRHLA